MTMTVDPLTLLTEIAQTAMDRMNTATDEKPVSPWEAHTLGRITSIAIKCPGVLEGLKDEPPARTSRETAHPGP